MSEVEGKEVTHINNINMEFRNELIKAFENQDDIKEYNQMMNDSIAFCKSDPVVYYQTADGEEFDNEDDLKKHLESDIYKIYLEEYEHDTIEEKKYEV